MAWVKKDRISWTGLDKRNYEMEVKTRRYWVGGEEIDVEELPPILKKSIKSSKIPVLVSEPLPGSVFGTNVWKVFAGDTPFYYRKCLHCDAVESVGPEVVYKVIDNLRIGFCIECVNSGEYKNSPWYGSLKNKEFRWYERSSEYREFRDNFLRKNPECDMCGGVATKLRLEPYTLQQMIDIIKTKYKTSNKYKIIKIMQNKFFNRLFVMSLCEGCHRNRVAQERRKK